MDISVIVPIYGVEKYIEKCLRSLFEQTKRDGVEFILVNDCTPDRSMEIAKRVIEEYDNVEVRIIDHTKNRGIAATRQTGFDAASGDYIMQIDSDDWCEPAMLEELYSKAIDDSADIVACDFFDYDDSVITNIHTPNKIENIKSLMSKNRLFPAIWARLIRRDLYINNELKFDYGINNGEDAVIMPMLYYVANKVVYLSNAYLHYTCNPKSLTNNININLFLDHAKMAYVWDSFFKNTPDYSKFKPYIDANILFKKHQILRMSRGKEQQYYNKSFPVKCITIFQSNGIAFSAKVTMVLANIGLLPIANLLHFLGEKIHGNIIEPRTPKTDVPKN